MRSPHSGRTWRYILEATLVGVVAVAILLFSLFELYSRLVGAPNYSSDSVKLEAIGALLGGYVCFILMKYCASESKLDSVLDLAEKKGVWTFISRDKWLNAMIDCARRADAVSTQHYSDPPTLSKNSVRYFNAIQY
jgi:Co/Zn/Cd efflux system component